MGSAITNLKQQIYDEVWAEDIWKEGWAYIKTIVTTVQDPFLILDKNLCVRAANRSFYKLFQAKEKDLEYKYIDEIGRGGWNIAALESLLKVIVPRNVFFNGFEINPQFPSMGKKIMVLNGKSIYKDGKEWDIFPPIILFAMTDINEMTAIAEALSYYAGEIENRMFKRTQNLEAQIGQLKKDIGSIKAASQNNLL